MGLMRKRWVLFGEGGGEKNFLLSVFITVWTLLVLLMLQLRSISIFPPKRKSAFRAFFLSSSSGSLSAFLNRFNC